MVLRDGKPYMSFGTPGGDQQDQWTLPVLPASRAQPGTEPRMNLQEAIDAPAWHIEHFPLSFWPRKARPGVLVVEDRLPTTTIKDLERRGHKVEVGARLVGRPPHGREPGRRTAQSCRQRARHAGLRGGALRLCAVQTLALAQTGCAAPCSPHPWGSTGGQR